MREKLKIGVNYRWSLIVLSVASLYIMSFAFLSEERLICSVSDDAYYYLQVSRNIAIGMGSTFDGINKTNGYHPFWLIILIPVHLIVGFSRIGAIRSLFIIEMVFYFLTIFLLIRGLRGRLGYIGSLSIIAISLYPRFFHIITVGLESSLLLFLLTLLWFYLRKILGGRGGLKGAFILGLLLGLIILARFEVGVILTFISLLTIIIFRYSKWNKKAILIVIISFAISSLIVLPFLIWNYLNFGHFMTISASLKSSFPNTSFNYKYIITYPEYYIGVIIFLFLLFVREDNLSGELLPDLILGISCLFMLISFLLFGRWAHFSHHYAPTLLLIFISTAIIVEAIYKRISKVVSSRFIGTIMILLFIIFACYSQFIVYRETMNTFRKASYEGAKWVGENTDRDDIFAMKDCGAFGYLSERRTINLDGVVNNFVYQEYLKDGRLTEYLGLMGVDYIVQHSVPLDKKDYDVYEQIYPCRLYGGEGGRLELRREDEEFRFYYIDEAGDKSMLVIWKID
ncbi:MAG: hypothetical protein ACUVWP_04110 [bacterium]